MISNVLQNKLTKQYLISFAM